MSDEVGTVRIMDEDTERYPVCPVCGESQYEDECEHALATIDRTFGEVQGGALFGQEYLFREAVETAFYGCLSKGLTPTLENYPELEAVWSDAKGAWERGEICTREDVSGYIGYQGYWDTLEEVLINVDAIEAPGDFVFDLPIPGGGSVMSLLFAEKPQDVINRALAEFIPNLESDFGVLIESVTKDAHQDEASQESGKPN